LKDIALPKNWETAKYGMQTMSTLSTPIVVPRCTRTCI